METMEDAKKKKVERIMDEEHLEATNLPIMLFIIC